MQKQDTSVIGNAEQSDCKTGSERAREPSALRQLESATEYCARGRATTGQPGAWARTIRLEQ